jgi:hypothetical protein
VYPAEDVLIPTVELADAGSVDNGTKVDDVVEAMALSKFVHAKPSGLPNLVSAFVFRR